MTKSPLISVIMPVYNEDLHELHDSINSILNQTYKKIEYIIIDDNPNNEVIHAYLKAVSLNDDRIKLIFHKINHGLIYSENEGVRFATGIYVARLDADDISKFNRLEKQLLFLNNNNLDLVCSNFSVINEHGNVTRQNGYRGTSVISQSKMKHIMSHCNIAINPTLFFKRSLFNELNGYRDTKIGNINVEDYDFVARAMINDNRVGYYNVPVIYKRLRKNSISYGTIFSQYLVMKTISDYLRDTQFTKVIPIGVIRNKLKNISEKRVKRFHNFVNARYSFNDNHNLKYAFNLFKSIIISFTVIKWCIWDVKNKLYE